MLSKFDIEKIQSLSIEQVAYALGLVVQHHKALCPFHEDSHPSLTFHTGRNRYRCFVCGASGGPIDLVMHYLNKSFLDACKWLVDDFNVWLSDPSNLKLGTWNLKYGTNSSAGNPPPSKPFDASRYARFFERPWLSAEAQRFLFEERRLDPRVVRWCRLTSWRDKYGIPWLQTPYYDRTGKLIGIQNRNLSSSATQPSALNSQPRFRFPQGAKCSIYNLQILKLLRPGETLFIAEGCSDAWSLLSAGHKAIAIPSATLLTKQDKELLQSLNPNPSSLNLHFAMYPDQDVPGERLFLQLQKVLPNLVRYQLPKECKDFSDYYLSNLEPGTNSSAAMLNVKC